MMNYFSSSEGKHTPEQSRKRSRESLTSCFRAANIFIQEDNHEITQKMGLSWAGPWKSRCTVIMALERAFIHTSYPVREGKQGVYPRGQPKEMRGRGWFNEKNDFSYFETYYTSGFNFTLRLSLQTSTRRSVNKCWQGGVIKGETVVSLTYEESHTQKKIWWADACTANTAPNEQSNNN